ncbi:hypothetical protein JCM11491_000831 [Sporobolomyces phaffii]
MNCFVCSEYLNGDDRFVQSHLNRCLDRQGSSCSSIAGAPTSASSSSRNGAPSTASSSSPKPLAHSYSQDEALALSLAQQDDMSFSAPAPDPSSDFALEHLVCPCCQALWDDVGLVIGSAMSQSDREVVESRRRNHVVKCLEGRQTFHGTGEDNDPLQHGDYDSGEGPDPFEIEIADAMLRGKDKGKGKMGWTGAVGTKAEVKGTPRILPILRQALAKSHASPHGRTLVAYLATEHVEHIGTRLGDWGWGCGYKNLQMLISSARHLPQYRQLFATRTLIESPREVEHDPSIPAGIPVPTILELQEIIQAAWSLGFDPPGAQHFRHQLIGKKSWIGTTEVFTALTSIGIRQVDQPLLLTRIVDFPKIKKGQEQTGTRTDGTHQTLIKWIISYFSTPSRPVERAAASDSAGTASSSATILNDGPPEPKNAFTTLLSSAHRSSAILTVSPNKQPLYLQHQGHSRTIVGVERMKTKRGCAAGAGEEWLLIFDPGKPIPNDLKRLSQASLENSDDSPPLAKKYKPSGFGQLSSAMSKTKSKDESVGRGGDVKFGDVLKVFRVNMKDLKKRDEYQILYVEEDGAPLTEREKEQRKSVKAANGKSIWTPPTLAGAR